MKSRMLGFFLLIFQITMLTGLMTGNSLAFEKPLRTEVARAEEVSGVFTVIRYGGTFIDDPETIAFLDLEGEVVDRRLGAVKLTQAIDFDHGP